MSQSLMDAVTDSVQNPEADSGNSAFDVDAGVFDGFEARLENLHWRENNEGVLMVGNGERDPEKIVSIALVGGELEVNDEEPQSLDWERMRLISRPESAATPQFD